MRLDQYLVENKFFDSRNKAQAAINNNAISINGKIVAKPSYDVLEHDKVEIIGDVCPYVSRGGYKLLAAIKNFYLDFNGKTILDIGSSTGGFTDCALQNGAKLVYAVDVGSNQLDPKLRNDSRVISMENTNILDATINDTIDFLVMDVSFVSIEYLLPGINKFITDNNALVCLIKPQFEVGKAHLKNGIVKDKNVHKRVIDIIILELMKYNLGIYKLIPSPIKGGSGNKEFLCLIKRGLGKEINVLSVVEKE